MQLLNFSQYAKHRGVSVEAVSKAVRTGRVTVVATPDGQRFINPETADAEWDRNSDASKQVGGQAAAEAAREKRESDPEAIVAGGSESFPEPTDGPAEPIDDAGPDGVPPVEESASTGYAKHRATREMYQAELARVAYEEKAGKLVPADDVKAEFFRLARLTREAILNLPDRIAAEVHDMTSAEAVADFLREQLEEALEELTRAG